MTRVVSLCVRLVKMRLLVHAVAVMRMTEMVMMTRWMMIGRLHCSTVSIVAACHHFRGGVCVM